MNWFDPLIIYLAFGMPFAIYRFILSESAGRETAIRSLEAGFLWPFDGGKATFKRLRSASRALSRPRIETIRSELENLLGAEVTTFRPFEFREVFDSYVGLSRAVASEAQPAVLNLFSIVETEASAVTRACFRRSGSARMECHAASARSDLLRYVTASSSPRIFELAVSLARDLSDTILTSELSRHNIRRDKIRPASLPRLSGSAS